MRNIHTLHGTSLSSGRKPWGTLDKYLDRKGLAQPPSSMWVLQEKHRAPIQAWHPLAIFLRETVQPWTGSLRTPCFPSYFEGWLSILGAHSNHLGSFKTSWCSGYTSMSQAWIFVESYFPCMGILYPRWFWCVATMRTTDVHPFCSVFTASHTTAVLRMHECNPRSHPRSGTLYYPPRFTVEETASVQGQLAWGTGSNWPIDCILTAQQRLWVSIWKAQNHKTQGKGTAQRNNIKISGRKQKIQDATLPKVLWIFRFLKWLLAVRLNSAVEVGEVELGTTGLWRTWDLGSLLSHHSVHSPNAQSPILHLKFLVFTQVMCQQMLESPSPGRMKKVQTWYCNSLYYSSGWARSKERKFS